MKIDKNFRVKDLINHLKQFDENLPIIVLRTGNDHSFTVNKNQIEVVDYAYFGNDKLIQKDVLNSELFLKIGEV